MNDKDNDTQIENFKNRSMDYMPRWAWAVCAILFSISVSIRQIGLDVTTPLNRIMTAYAVRIERSQVMEDIPALKTIYTRLERLEKNSHPPGEKSTGH